MGVYLAFAQNHWLLSSLFVLAVIAFVINEAIMAMRGAVKINPQMVVNLINREQALVLDLRSSEEFKAGHIASAKQVDASQLTTKIENLAKDKAHAIVFICSQGQHSLRHVQQVQKLGYQRVYYLAQGMAAWRQDDLPVVK